MLLLGTFVLDDVERKKKRLEEKRLERVRASTGGRGVVVVAYGIRIKN